MYTRVCIGLYSIILYYMQNIMIYASGKKNSILNSLLEAIK